MTKLTRYRHLWACCLAFSNTALVANRAVATGNNFDTAQSIDLNRRYEGSLPIGQGRHCYRLNVPSGKKVTIQGSNNYGAVFVSAYTGHGNLLIGETQILSSFQPTALVQTEENDGGVMVCIDSDTAQRQKEHGYSLQVSITGEAAVATVPAALKRPVTTQPLPIPQSVPTVRVVKNPAVPKPLPVVAPTVRVAKAPEPVVILVPPARVAKNPVTANTPEIPPVIIPVPPARVAKAPEAATIYPQPKTRKSEVRESQVSPYVNSPLQLAANSRSFDQAKDGGNSGDAGNNFQTARAVTPEQMYGGYLNAKGKDDRDCYVYSDLPSGSKLKVSVANNDGILGISAYSDRGSILIGQTYIINQQGLLKTEAISGDVMVCMDTDGEKSDHQYTFNGRVEN
jgi:hypothetical protein